jgi:hypothetical protein
MERDPRESLEAQLESILQNGRPEDITPAAFAGILATLTGWKRTYQEDEPHAKQPDRARILKQWSEEARDIVMALPETSWACVFEVGDRSIVGHELRLLDGRYALYDKAFLPARRTYKINFAGLMDVPSDSHTEDLPDIWHSDLQQLYIGDTIRSIAVSYNQFTGSMIDSGTLNLIPKDAFPAYYR